MDSSLIYLYEKHLSAIQDRISSKIRRFLDFFPPMKIGQTEKGRSVNDKWVLDVVRGVF